MVDFVTALATASQALKLVNDLRGIEKEYDKAELKLKIADLTGALADLKMTLVEARDEIHTKQAEIEALKAAMKRNADLVEAHGFRYDKAPDGSPKGFAYCAVCELKGDLIHVTSVHNIQFCPKCKGHSNAPAYAN